ncbi:helix-turn-helix transcriptional regulator [Vibrio kyushuensis]|uniref:helix-turn-helix transcriptional regulator n=1 Tax=Vibrio kyushuensis TaxID=2910249 RepID=UPI003D13F0F3
MRQFTFIMRIVDSIELMLPRKLDVTKLAQQLNVSKWHLQHEFKRYTGMSVGHYYRARLLSLAAIEIANSDKRLIDIALEFGFDSHEAFYRAFKKQFHVSPKHLKYSSRFAEFIFELPITPAYLTFVSTMEASPPVRSVFSSTRVQGVPEVFLSISICGDEFSVPLKKLWSEFEQATDGWNHQDRKYYTLEYRNNCTYLSGLFQMLVVCDGLPEESKHTLTEVTLPTRDMWQFRVENVESIAVFFQYLHLVFMPKHQFTVKALPIIWHQQPDGVLICSIELLAQQENTLPKSVLELGTKLVTRPLQQGALDSYQISSHCVLKHQRLSEVITHFKSKQQLINSGLGAILIGRDEQGVFEPKHDYDSAFFEFSQGSGQVLPASYLQCKLQGTVREIGDDLEMLYYYYLSESPFYLVRGYEWITSLISIGPKSEDQEWQMELLIPVKKR